MHNTLSLMEHAEMSQAIDTLLEPLLRARKHLGVTVGVIAAGQRVVKGYGTLGAKNLNPPDGRTLFEIGSVTKVLTALLLAALVEDGSVQEDAPVCELLPEGQTLPPEVTLRSLATHTSGLPRVPSNVWPAFLRHPRNPYAAYSRANLVAYLARYRSASRSSGHYLYSNLGVGLLGHTLAHLLGEPYEEAVVTRICTPLALSDTRIAIDSEMLSRLASPHTASGRTTSSWDMPALAGAGALRSTVDDLLSLLAANLDVPHTLLGSAIAACHTPRADTSIPGRRIGLGWLISPLGGSTDTVCWHNGTTGGYRSFVGFVKERGTAVVILSNHGPGFYDRVRPVPAIDTIALRILRRLETLGSAEC